MSDGYIPECLYAELLISVKVDRLVRAYIV